MESDNTHACCVSFNSEQTHQLTGGCAAKHNNTHTTPLVPYSAFFPASTQSLLNSPYRSRPSANVTTTK